MIGRPTAWVSSSAPVHEILQAGLHKHDAFKIVNAELVKISMEMQPAKLRMEGFIKQDIVNHDHYTVYVRIEVENGHTEYEEPWEDFPSEAFKVTLAMVAG